MERLPCNYGGKKEIKIAKWQINGYGHFAARTDSSEIAYLEADNDAGEWVIVHEESSGKHIVRTGTTQFSADCGYCAGVVKRSTTGVSFAA